MKSVHYSLVPGYVATSTRSRQAYKGVKITSNANCGRKGWKHCLPVALTCAAALRAVETSAGFYLGASVGADRSPSMRLVSGDDDRATRCDEYVNPRYAELSACTTSDRSIRAADAWASRFASAWGAQAGVAPTSHVLSV